MADFQRDNVRWELRDNVQLGAPGQCPLGAAGRCPAGSCGTMSSWELAGHVSHVRRGRYRRRPPLPRPVSTGPTAGGSPRPRDVTAGTVPGRLCAPPPARSGCGRASGLAGRRRQGACAPHNKPVRPARTGESAGNSPHPGRPGQRRRSIGRLRGGRRRSPRTCPVPCRGQADPRIDGGTTACLRRSITRVA